jgi:hypothetical protein
MITSNTLEMKTLPCKSCQSNRQRNFPSEMAVHLPFVLGTATEPHEMIFPELLICLDCGFTEFLLPVSSLHRLSTTGSAPSVSTQL